MPVRIAILQFAPILGQLQRNITHATRLLESHFPVPSASTSTRRNPDILILPELAFTGYNFPTPEDIRPFLEPTAAGATTAWAKGVARKWGMHVLVGYPELCSLKGTVYNSAVFVSPTGDVIANYRKHFLYSTDERWGASEGPGFWKGWVGTLGKRVTLGICMDLNPYKFEADFGAYEFAHHILGADDGDEQGGEGEGADLVLVPMAWLRHPRHPADAHPADPDQLTVGYWIQRLAPLWQVPNDCRSGEEGEDRGPTGGNKTMVFVACNRTGTEGESTFAGTSAVVELRRATPPSSISPPKLMDDHSLDGPTLMNHDVAAEADAAARSSHDAEILNLLSSMSNNNKRDELSSGGAPGSPSRKRQRANTNPSTLEDIAAAAVSSSSSSLPNDDQPAHARLPTSGAQPIPYTPPPPPTLLNPSSSVTATTLSDRAYQKPYAPQNAFSAAAHVAAHAAAHAQGAAHRDSAALYAQAAAAAAASISPLTAAELAGAAAHGAPVVRGVSPPSGVGTPGPGLLSSAPLNGGSGGGGGGGGGGGPGTPKPSVGSDEWHKQRRDNHKEVERRRREMINDGINALASLVPRCEKNKGSILQRAVEHIKELQHALGVQGGFSEEVGRLREEVRGWRERIGVLEGEKRGLEEEMSRLREEVRRLKEEKGEAA
ncbi:carbon-nitrogen hydrolase [Saitoella complicata NRRL Y-17804]|uniref:BHLH domain-containing protein n=1 Tax=Saitoella complicata (strain BCRC 22490 / CBS 7301 / JCM 7358 / NBRC 10748 / NRRL Y-17804) TaxID=698492 RepID=A0A0E9NJV1_SAICN|nr:carbon-nitrogen hydrolase [Saitoella complicata NRRL Y-17804]ODQ54548.1 carbon-nitrogen hydrolase [Saitoella complicata NRRL Y-17804]GAO50083.1 hypothetical protein G7K_4218-t1 [Saitoella complicata NRRL Y-17804]